MGFFVCLAPSSEEFKRVKKKLNNSWSSEKGSCPSVRTIIAIINPMVEKQFDAYRDRLASQRSEMYFHGTKFSCHLEENQTLCCRDDCSVCSIAKHGFSRKFIRDRWQRFGPAFYLAPNSSKSHDYCSKPNTAHYSAMLLCEVAPGKKHTLTHNMTSLQEPPVGCQSVYGMSNCLFLKGDLNYDEIVIF